MSDGKAMNQEELAAFCLDTVMASGAQDVRVKVSTGTYKAFSYRDGKPELINQARYSSVYTDIIANHRYSGQSTSDLRPEALKKFLVDSVERAKLMQKDPAHSIPSPKYFKLDTIPDLKGTDPDYGRREPKDFLETLHTLEDLGKQGVEDLVISSEAHGGEADSNTLCLTSQGFSHEDRSTSAWLNLMLVLKDRDERKPAGAWGESRVEYKNLPSLEFFAQKAQADVKRRLDPRVINSAKLPVIVEYTCTGNLIWALISAINGGNIYRRNSFLANKGIHPLTGVLGTPLGNPLLDLREEPHLPSLHGSRVFDGEGMVQKPRKVFDQGKVASLYVDWYHSKKLKTPPTNGGTSNLVFTPGSQSVAELMKTLGKGILIYGFQGGNSNPTTGDFSIGIEGLYFENGEVQFPVSGMNAAGNHLALWKNLVAVANDQDLNSSWQIPSLAFTDVAISGL